MTDAPTPNELLNEAAKLLGHPDLLDQNTGSLYRERFIASLILELAKRNERVTVAPLPSEVNNQARKAMLTLPRKK